MERCDGHKGCKGVWEGVIAIRRCDSPLGGLEYFRMVERCYGHWRDVKVLGEV